MEFLRSNSHEYDVWLMTVAILASGKLVSVRVDCMPKKRSLERFLKTDFWLATVDGRRRRYFIRKLACSAQPGTKLALRPNRITLITAPVSEVLNGP